VLDLLRNLGGELADSRPNPYADQLRKRLGGTCRNGLLDRLLLACVIERRSCERFGLLAAHARQPELRKLYGELAPEEIEHQKLFFEMAKLECGEENARQRLDHLLQIESEVAPGLEYSNRIHGGIRN
jgi:tRNA-(ms[2]io[6]A)-hydroxylase